ELLGSLSISEIREQLIEKGNQLWWATPPTVHRNRQGVSGSPFEANVSRDHLLLLEDGHIFQEQADHALAVPIRGALIIPHPWEIFCEFGNGLLFEGRELALFSLLLPLGFFLHLCQLTQVGVPVGLQ